MTRDDVKALLWLLILPRSIIELNQSPGNFTLLDQIVRDPI